MMYKVLIVDDEKIVRLAIKSMMQWDTGVYTFAGSAGSGEGALRICEREHPEIVITDLKMPGMDGIEMIRRLKAQGFDGEILVLSNYDDFELVREAMKCGAHDYILKAAVNADNFKSVLAEIVEKLDKRCKGAAGDTKSLFQAGQPAAFLRAVCERGQFLGETDPDNRMELGNGRYVQFFAVWDREGDARTGGKAMEEILKNIASDLNSGMDSSIALELQKRKNLLLLHFSADAAHAIEPSFAAGRIKSLVQMYYNREICVAYSENITEFAGLMRALKDGMDTLQNFFYRRYRQGNLPIGAFPVREDNERLPLFPEAVGRVCASVRARDTETLLQAVSSLIEAGERIGMHPAALKSELKKLLLAAEERLRGRSAGGSLFEYAVYGRDAVFGAATDDELLLSLRQVADAAITRYLDDGHYRREVEQSIRFIEQNVASHISVAQVAEHVNMTEAYISKLFRSETGRSMIDYINLYRMRKAYQMLSCGNHLIKEVAESVGIGDPFYFSRMFKKYYGVNPSSVKKYPAI